ncbi:MAG: hypothetical protein WCP77_19090 [Roseococcus sp.]
MSPEAKARIARVVMHVFREGVPAAKAGWDGAETLRYAETILENVVEEEVQRRLAARDNA